MKRFVAMVLVLAMLLALGGTAGAACKHYEFDETDGRHYPFKSGSYIGYTYSYSNGENGKHLKWSYGQYNCTQCGALAKTVEALSSQWEACTYVNGRCSCCGSAQVSQPTPTPTINPVTCRHADKTLLGTYLKKHLPAASNNDTNHFVDAENTYSCNLCGTVFVEWEEVGMEPHSFEKVRLENENEIITYDHCTECGSTFNREVTVLKCSHSWDGIQGMYNPQFSYTKQAEWYVYSPYPGSTDHSVKLMWTVTCNTCGESVTNVRADYYAAEQCTYQNGVCTKCNGTKPGYTPSTPTPTPTPTLVPVTPAPPTAVPVTAAPATEVPVTPVPGGCSHEVTRTQEGTIWEPKDDENHLMKAHYRVSCECGQVNEIQHVTAVYPHQFVDGVCRLCGYKQDICAIYGHEWTISYVDGIQIRCCLWCDAMEERVTPESQWWEAWNELFENGKDTADAYREMTGAENSGSSLWKVIAGQARDRLTDEGFVGFANGMEVVADQAESMHDYMYGAMVEKLFGDEYARLQADAWEVMVRELLKKDQEYYDNDEVSLDASLTEIEALVEEFTADNAKLKETKNLLNVYKINLLTYEMTLEMAMEDIAFSDLADFTKAEAREILNKKADNNIDQVMKVESDRSNIGKVTQVLGYLLEGAEAGVEYKKRQEEYEQLSRNYVNHMQTLLELCYDAQEMGCTELVTAIDNVVVELSEEYWEEKKKFDDFLCQTVEEINEELDAAMVAGGTMAKSVAIDVAQKIIDTTLPVLKVAGDISGEYNERSNVDEIYAQAEKLMLLSDMSNALDLNNALYNDQSSVAIYRLWAVVQAEGCEVAFAYVNEHVRNWSGQDIISVDLSELGLKEKERQNVLNALTSDKYAYEAYANFRFED